MAAASVYDFEAVSIDGKPAHLSTQRGKVLLIVNTASACGFTPQFAGLEKLWEDYRDRGLVVVGFPSNEFGGQDPGSNDEIASFCQLNYGVSFPMMAKVEVNGARRPPAVAVAQGEAPGLLGSEGVKWNFTKFLVGRDGQVHQALRAHRHARVAAQGHRGRAGGLNRRARMFEHLEPYRRRPDPEPERGLPEGPARRQGQPVDRHLLRRRRAHPGARLVRQAEAQMLAEGGAQALPADRRRGQLRAARCSSCCSAPGTRRWPAAASPRCRPWAPAAA